MPIPGSRPTTSEYGIRCGDVWIQPSGYAQTEPSGVPREFVVYTNLRAEDINRRDKRDGLVHFKSSEVVLKWANIIQRAAVPRQR